MEYGQKKSPHKVKLALLVYKPKGEAKYHPTPWTEIIPPLGLETFLLPAQVSSYAPF